MASEGEAVVSPDPILNVSSALPRASLFLPLHGQAVANTTAEQNDGAQSPEFAAYSSQSSEQSSGSAYSTEVVPADDRFDDELGLDRKKVESEPSASNLLASRPAASSAAPSTVRNKRPGKRLAESRRFPKRARVSTSSSPFAYTAPEQMAVRVMGRGSPAVAQVGRVSAAHLLARMGGPFMIPQQAEIGRPGVSFGMGDQNLFRMSRSPFTLSLRIPRNPAGNSMLPARVQPTGVGVTSVPFLSAPQTQMRYFQRQQQPFKAQLTNGSLLVPHDLDLRQFTKIIGSQGGAGPRRIEPRPASSYTRSPALVMSSSSRPPASQITRSHSASYIKAIVLSFKGTQKMKQIGFHTVLVALAKRQDGLCGFVVAGHAAWPQGDPSAPSGKASWNVVRCLMCIIAPGSLELMLCDPVSVDPLMMRKNLHLTLGHIVRPFQQLSPEDLRPQLRADMMSLPLQKPDPPNLIARVGRPTMAPPVRLVPKTSMLSEPLAVQSAPTAVLGTIAGKPGHICSMCGKTFSCKSSLTRHVRGHLGVRPFECKVCSKRFVNKGVLKIHENIHSGVKPYKCETCGKHFTQKGNLKRHMRIHLGVRPFKCTVCNKSFNQKEHLNTHLRIHTGQRPYRCVFCPRSFKQRSTLNGHLRTHTGDKPYACHLCHRTFRQRGNLTTHMTTHKRDLAEPQASAGPGRKETKEQGAAPQPAGSEPVPLQSSSQASAGPGRQEAQEQGVAPQLAGPEPAPLQ